MKRFLVLLSALFVSCALLSACSLLPARSTTIAQLLKSDEFDAMSAAVLDGTDVPAELILTVENGYGQTVTDQTFLTQIWNDLCNLEVSEGAPDEAPNADSGVAFSFKWADGRYYAFGFQTTEYFVDQAGTLHQLQDPSAMGAILTSIIEYLDQAEQSLQENAFDGSIIRWDIDGDGTYDTFTVTYHDNGEEAPNAVEIASVSGQYGSTWIDAAYEIQSVVVTTGQWDTYLLVTYLSGDYYVHDTVSTCEIHLVDGSLQTWYPEPEETTDDTSSEDTSSEETYVEPTYEETSSEETYTEPTYEESYDETYTEPTYEESYEESYDETYTEDTSYDTSSEESYDEYSYDEAA